MPERVLSTEAAATLVRQLRDQYGPVLLHQSGGCCEGSAPMCFRRSGFRVAARDVLLGVIEGSPFYVSAAQFPYWANSQLTIDVVSDGGDSFSLEAAEGVRFITRSRVFSDAEMDALDAAGPPPVGPDADGAMIPTARAYFLRSQLNSYVMAGPVPRRIGIRGHCRKILPLPLREGVGGRGEAVRIQIWYSLRHLALHRMRPLPRPPPTRGGGDGCSGHDGENATWTT